MTAFFTPATGFPDLEIKIAYGLARVGIEAGFEPTIKQQKGFYQIAYKNYCSEQMKRTLLMLLARLLSSGTFFDIGVKAKYKGNYPVNEDVIERIGRLNNIETFFDKVHINKNFNYYKERFCGHDKSINNFGGSSGLILLSSFHAGKPNFRDKISQNFNQNLCELCGYLAVLGFNSFGFTIQLGKDKNRKYIIFLPVSNKEISFNDLLHLLSLQKTMHNFWISDLLPLKAFTIGLLSKVPSLSDIVNDLQMYFHLTQVSKDSRGDTAVEQTAFVDAIPFSKFISNSPYNAATVDNLLGTYKIQPKISPLIEISSILEGSKSKNKRNDLLKFARIYVQETSTNDWTNLLYPETTLYLLKEIAMIRQDIIENEALNSLARTLRYFVREKKYSYADNIRNAKKESRTFEETIAAMLREVRLRLTHGEKIHIPTEEAMKEVFTLANEYFEEIKLALVILAFSFPASTKGVTENIEEVQNA